MFSSIKYKYLLDFSIPDGGVSGTVQYTTPDQDRMLVRVQKKRMFSPLICIRLSW